MELLYKFIESRPKRSIFNSNEIKDYINKHKKARCLLHLALIHKRQLKYHIFKRNHNINIRNSKEKVYEYTEYIYVRRSNETIRKH